MPERVLPLEGGRNFRDLGGYAAGNGRRVRWRQLFRSGAMSGLTEADYRDLADLGIAVICDFRTTAEREIEPTRWMGERTPVIRARDYDSITSHMAKALTLPGPPEERVVGAMKAFYTDLPYEHVESYRILFGELLAGRVPLVFNCSAGKDRTGVAAGLVLAALGVGRDDILADYRLTNKAFNFEALAANSARPDIATGIAAVAHLPPEIRKPMLRSDPAYLLAAFDEMSRRDGSTLGYLQAHLGVGPREVEALRAALLEPA